MLAVAALPHGDVQRTRSVQQTATHRNTQNIDSDTQSNADSKSLFTQLTGQRQVTSHELLTLLQAAYLRKSQVTQPVAFGCPDCFRLPNLQKNEFQVSKAPNRSYCQQNFNVCDCLLTTSTLGFVMGYSCANLKNQLRKSLNSISQASETIQMLNIW